MAGIVSFGQNSSNRPITFNQQTVTGASASDVAYGASWDGSQDAPTKNAVYDKIETVVSSVPAGANPTATIGLTAVDGSATTYLRSDGAPALSQSIVPTWTGQHTFNNDSGTVFQSSLGQATINTDAASFSYTNVGGSGDRKSLITVTTTITGMYLTPDYLVNGNTTESQFYWSGQTASGKYLRFDFGSGRKFVITEAKWYQDLTTSQGVWQWQGSNDATSWTSIGATFTLGGSATQTQTELSGNTTAYRYYQLLGVSGSLSGSPYDREMEFKIAPATTQTAVDVASSGTLALQPSGGATEIGGMAVFKSGVIFNSVPLLSSQWQNSGSSIYFPVTGNTGDVGFGRVPASGYRVDIDKVARVASDVTNQPAEFYWRNSGGYGYRLGIDAAVSPVIGPANAAYISLTTASAGLIIYDNSTERYRFQLNGDAGFGTASPSAKLHLVKTTEQLRVGYDASNYYKTTVGSTGGVTFDAVGSGAAFTFSDPVTATQLTSSGLTAGRVTFAGTAGILTDDADFTFATDTLTATKIVGTTSIKVGTAAGYISSDGSTGATGTFTTVDLKTVTVKDGIITAIV